MTLSTTTDTATASATPAAIPSSGLFSVPGLVFIGLMLTLIMSNGVIREFMTTGYFRDPDDAMRLAQARDFLHGQGWFDLTSWRLDPPHGVFMHWTRVVDVPIVVLIKFFSLFTDQETAERLMRLVFPMALLGCLFALTMRTSRMLIGASGPLVALLLCVFGGAIFGYFDPGRLDHDHVAIIGLVLMVGTLMRALDPMNWRAAGYLGLIIAFNLSISLETLPFIVMGVAALPAAWIIQGQTMRRSLQIFSTALFAGLLIAFAVTVAPVHYLAATCDTLSAAHMVAGLTGAALCLALASLTSILPNVPMRLAAGVAAGLATVAAVAVTYPACLADPYANIDPVLRELWLDGVSEARPLAKAIAMRPGLLYILVVPILIGLVGAVWGAVAERGVLRSRWLAITAIVLAGCAASIWQVRATGVVAPLSLFGSAYLVSRLTRGLFARGSALAVPGLAIGSLVVSPLFFGLTVPDISTPQENTRGITEVACRVQSAFAAIAALPHGNILAPIDTGAHLLARTMHGVFAAPFHRDEHGNRLALDAFRADPQAAEAIVRKEAVDYILFCPAINDLELYHDIAPNGLAAQLDDGKVPDWLEPLALDTPYKVFRVK